MLIFRKMCSGVIGVMLPAECWNYTEDCMVFPVQRQTDRSGKLWERGNTGRIIRWFIQNDVSKQENVQVEEETEEDVIEKQKISEFVLAPEVAKSVRDAMSAFRNR